MRILGIYDDHNCSSAVVEDGRIIAAIEEERLSRIKFHNGNSTDGPPWRSLEKVLEMTGSDSSNIDRISIAIEHPAQLQKYVLKDLFLKEKEPKWILHSMFSKSIRWDRYFLFYAYYFNQRRILKLKKLLKKYDLADKPIDLVNHHTAHAASAYYTGGSKNALVVTLDGQGDGLAGTIFRGREGKLDLMAKVPSFHSIGLFYNLITWMLGFKPNRHEGKITGLAAYGDPEKTREIYEKFFDMDGHEFRYKLAKKVLHHAYPHRSNYPKLVKAMDGLLKDFTREDIAAGVQDITEKYVARFVEHYVNLELKDNDHIDVRMAGGVFANVKVNQRVAELDGVSSVFIFPSMGDGGLSAGAALWSFYNENPEQGIEIEKRKIKDVYLGPEYTQKEIEESLKKSKNPYKFYDNIEEKIGELLAQGKVVARFNGRMEYGPRALGNRSILYQATDPTVNDWLNHKLKRTEFMPFAPVTLYDKADQMYENLGSNYFPAEYMTITFNCTDEMAKMSPATVHVDKTARPQLTNKEINESYSKILEAYEKRTGIPTIINTSFNMHEEPIVCTPDDAVRAFNMGHLEYLAIGNFLVEETSLKKRE